MHLSTWLAFERTHILTPAIVRAWVHRSAILHGEREPVARRPGPAFEGHPFGLAGDVGQGCAAGLAEAAEMHGGAGDAHDGHEQAIGVNLHGDVQGLHNRRMPLCRQ